MRPVRPALLVFAVAVLAVGACSKPEAETTPEAHDEAAADAAHGSEPTDAVVTMEQAVADARVAAEAPAAAQPAATPAIDSPASGAPGTESHGDASATAHSTTAATEPASAPAPSGH